MPEYIYNYSVLSDVAPDMTTYTLGIKTNKGLKLHWVPVEAIGFGVGERILLRTRIMGETIQAGTLDELFKRVARIVINTINALD